MSAYDKTSIQINRCKRILALVDDYVEKQDAATRTDLRKALMEEFEAPAIAPPVGDPGPVAGILPPDRRPRASVEYSVEGGGTVIINAAGSIAYRPPVAAGSVNMQRYAHGYSEMVEDDDGSYVEHDAAIAWGAQQREAGRLEGRRDAHETNIVVLGDCLKAEARVKELEAALAKAYPNAIDPGNTPC